MQRKKVVNTIADCDCSYCYDLQDDYWYDYLRPLEKSALESDKLIPVDFPNPTTLPHE